MDRPSFASKFDNERLEMVEHQIKKRGVKDARVLKAMQRVPREIFIPEKFMAYAYADRPLEIGLQQTISQPYIVALMAEALELKPGDRVLEIGAGSGYAAAVLAEIAGDVITIERHKELADIAGERLHDLGYDNAAVIWGDGAEGFEAKAPFDAIVSAAAGREIPQKVMDQLAVGGRLVFPVGGLDNVQSLKRIRRLSDKEFVEENLTNVRFVPLVAGTDENLGKSALKAAAALLRKSPTLLQRIYDAAEPFDAINGVDLSAFLDRVGDKRVVLLGEASHGSHEFYKMRARITQELIEKKGFTIVAAEADWPDAAHIDHYVQHYEYPPKEWLAFARFPKWMWRNSDVRDFVDWLRGHNGLEEVSSKRCGFYGLDIYSLFQSIDAVIEYLMTIDKDAAEVARARYGCLAPWRSVPEQYGRDIMSGRYEACAGQVTKMLVDLHEKQGQYQLRDGERFLDARQNAELVTDAEVYYRRMYQGSFKAWNLRDKHMFETLKAVMAFRGSNSKAIVWAHNSHIGDASQTEMGDRREWNIGQLCRQHFAEDAYLVGFGCHDGEVAAASDWGGEMEVKVINPSLKESYERLCHDVGVERFFLPLGKEYIGDLHQALAKRRLERAIGVIYRPQTERASHYFEASLSNQFNEYIWFDRTRPVVPLKTHELKGMPDTYPFGI